MSKMIKAGMDGKQMRSIAKGSESKKPMIKPSHKGLLHKKLGVAEGKKIPASKLNAALHSKSASLRKEANFAKNFGK